MVRPIWGQSLQPKELSLRLLAPFSPSAAPEVSANPQIWVCLLAAKNPREAQLSLSSSAGASTPKTRYDPVLLLQQPHAPFPGLSKRGVPTAAANSKN